MNRFTSTVSEIKRYLTLPVIALSVNFIGTLLIAYASEAPGTKSGLSITFSGAQNVLLVHPFWLWWGIRLLALGFLIQLIAEIVKVRKGKNIKYAHGIDGRDENR